MASDKDQEVNEFFQCLGEIWRDVAAIEFLMRCAIAQEQGDKDKVPRWPYHKGSEYDEYPASFSLMYFSDVVREFQQTFPEFAAHNPQIWDILIEFRNAMAHGVIAEISNSGVDELVKFKLRNKKLVVEYQLPLEMQRLRQLRQSFNELRRHIMNEARDRP